MTVAYPNEYEAKLQARINELEALLEDECDRIAKTKAMLEAYPRLGFDKRVQAILATLEGK